MAHGNLIVVSAEPKGRFQEVIVVGTPKPGTVMELVVGVAAVNGVFSFEPAGTTANNSTYSGMAADGNRLPICVLDADWLQGKNNSDAYTTGTRGMVYYPIPGEHLNIILKNEAGTAADQDFTIGTKLIVDDGTGTMIASQGSPESEPFICLEVKADLAADYLAWAQFTGV